MRVLALVTEAFGGSGGLAQANRDLLNAVSNVPGVESIVVLPRLAGKPAKKSRQPLIQMKAVQNRIAYAASAAWCLLRHGPFDLIFCGHLFMMPLAHLLSRLAGIPVWLHVHGIEAWERPGQAVRASAESARLVTAISRFTRRKLLSWAAIPPERVRVLPDTVDERFSPGIKPASLIRRHGLEGKKILLTVSRLSAEERYKGHDRVISVLPGLLRAAPDLAYVIAGEGNDRGRLERLAAELNVSGSVIFLGYVDDAMLVDVYRMADLFVMPSTGEGFGIAFLEAARSGIQVIGGNEDGSRDALRDGRIGRAVDPRDLEQLSQAILRALASPAEPVTEAKTFCRENFSRFTRELIHGYFAVR